MKQADVLQAMLKCKTQAEAFALAIEFTWFGLDGTQLHFAVGMMAVDQRIKDLETVLVPMDYDFAEWVRDNRGVETHRVMRLLSIPVESFDPVFYAHMEHDDPPSHLLIDGSHRYVAAWHKRAPEIPAKIIPEKLWREFIIEDAPQFDEETLKRSFSGIL